MAITRLEEFVPAFSRMLAEAATVEDIIERGRPLLAELVSAQGWLREVLTRLIEDEAFLKAQWHSVDPNDITIFRSPDKAYTVRAFIWEPFVRYPIHDHGAWGLVGAHINQVGERKFERLDDGSQPYHAEIRLKSEAVLNVGETTFVLPADAGIHQMECVNDRVAVTIHVYGAPVRKGYINYFSPHDNTCRRVFPPQVLHKVLAIRTLGSVAEPWAEELLSRRLQADEPDYLREEYRRALARLEGR